MNEREALQRAVVEGRVSAAQAQAAIASGSLADLLRQLSAQRRVGPYELVRELARGGMGAVYLARRPGLDRDVALKLLLSGAGADPEEIERFRREARVSARLRHPHIVAIHDVGQDGGDHYLVMDLIEGESLAGRLKRDGPLEVDALVRIGQSLAEALAYAHRQSVLHRDLKPHNVLLDSAEHAYLTDFGLAKDVGKDVKAGPGLTLSGAVMGTPAYMPPEQAEGAVDLVDRRSDVYGLGATLYHALTGQAPFEGASVINILNAVLTREPTAPRSLRAEIPRDLETIVLTCLAKDPAERYPSAQALAEDLARFASGRPIEARPATVLDRAWKWVGRNRAVAGAAALGVLALTLGPLGATAWTARAQEGLRAELAQTTREAFEAAIANVPSSADTREASLVDAQDALLAAERWHALDPSHPPAQAGMGRALEEVVARHAARLEWGQARRVLATAKRRQGLLPFVARLAEGVAANEAQGLAKDRAAIDAVTDAGVSRAARLKLGLALTRGSSRTRVQLFAAELERISQVVAETSRPLVKCEEDLVARWTGAAELVLSAAERGALTRAPGFLRRGPAVEEALGKAFSGTPLIRARFLCELLGRTGGAHPDLAIPALARFTRLAWSQESASIGFSALAQCGTPAARRAFLAAYRLFDGSWATRTTARQFSGAFEQGKEVYDREGALSEELFARAQAFFHAGAAAKRLRGKIQHLLNGIALAHQAREEYPESLRATSLLIEGWQAAGVPQEGRAAARRAQGLAPEDSRLALQSAATHGGDVLASILDLDRALALDSESWNALHLRAEQHLLAGHFDKALEDALRLIRELPEDLNGHVIRAKVLIELNRSDESEVILLKAAQRWPRSFVVQRSLARVLAIGGDAEGMNAALARSGNWTFEPFVRWLLGGEGTGRLEEMASDEWLKSLTPHESGLVLERLAHAEAGRGNLEAALMSSEFALKLRPGLMRIRIMRGGIRAEQGRTAAAALDFSRVLSREPQRALLRAQRQSLADSLGAAEMVLRDAKILATSELPAARRSEALARGAAAALQLERLEEAEGLARGSLELLPAQIHAHRILGEVVARRGARAEAVKHFRQWLGQVPLDHPARARTEARLRELEGR